MLFIMAELSDDVGEERLVSAATGALQLSAHLHQQMGRRHIFRLAKCVCSLCTGPSEQIPRLSAGALHSPTKHLVTVNYSTVLYVCAVIDEPAGWLPLASPM